MGIEEDLANMLKFTKLKDPKQINEMLGTLVVSVQVGMLKKMRGEMDRMIRQLQTSSSMGRADPYAILGVNSTANKDEIEKAYKKKAWGAHPDHGGSDEQMVLVNAAYEAIKRVRGWTK